jgi:hypothetical protein
VRYVPTDGDAKTESARGDDGTCWGRARPHTLEWTVIQVSTETTNGRAANGRLLGRQIECLSQSCRACSYWGLDGWQRPTLRLAAELVQTLGEDQYAAGLERGKREQRPDSAS